MNKISLIAIIAGMVTLVSCSEKGPIIDFGGEKAVDTSYMQTTVEGKMPRKVLVEEFTGVSCPPCPNGHRKLKQLGDQNPNRIVVIGYHIFNFPQAFPVEGKSKYDFRTEDATNVGKDLFGGVGQLPNAGIDRTSTNGKLLYDAGSWSGTIENRLPVAAPVNVHIINTYDDATREAIIKVQVVYTEAISTPQHISLAIVEDDIEDAQKDGLTEVEEYIHEHVLRAFITPFNGYAFLSGQEKTPGLVYERTFTYTVNEKWNADNCKLIAFVSNDGENKEVLQAEQVSLK